MQKRHNGIVLLLSQATLKEVGDYMLKLWNSLLKQSVSVANTPGQAHNCHCALQKEFRLSVVHGHEFREENIA
eukprot:2914049-Amphidinium_carterae.1